MSCFVDQLSCGLCCNQYETAAAGTHDRRPRLLHCGHVPGCTDCVRRLAQPHGFRKVVCPECRKETCADGSALEVKDLPLCPRRVDLLRQFSDWNTSLLNDQYQVFIQTLSQGSKLLTVHKSMTWGSFVAKVIDLTGISETQLRLSWCSRPAYPGFDTNKTLEQLHIYPLSTFVVLLRLLGGCCFGSQLNRLNC
eukprot:TRINITY_DN12645_c0_g1_i1.p1 TRINITY_DN12645_c0_g1~~TRINITY_DN12645_c0_g1_i1.p1  ORF type:complete len:194 (+),score=49.06 TRINITY_DN12645_c0_g1_i1:58-639(+)